VRFIESHHEPRVAATFTPEKHRAAVGASHQTVWTGLETTFIQLFGSLDAMQLLDVGKKAAFGRMK